MTVVTMPPPASPYGPLPAWAAATLTPDGDRAAPAAGVLPPPATPGAAWITTTGDPDLDALDRALGLGRRLVDEVETLALQLGIPELGDIELPPVVGSAADQAHLRAAAPLYLAAELEAARLLPAAEVLAGVFASGGLSADVGTAAPLLAAFWRGRHQRFPAQERRAFFARLFGSPGLPLAGTGSPNTEFEPLLIGLAETLHAVQPDRLVGPLPASQVPLRTAAAQLAANLIPRSGGMAAYAARDILDAIAQALAILRNETLQGVVGGRSVWLTVRAVAQRYLGEDPQIDPHLTRGRSGTQMLEWLAEVLPRLEQLGGSLITARHPVVGAATAWLQATLGLYQSAEAMAGRTSTGTG
jgi:hypothetical protein